MFGHVVSGQEVVDAIENVPVNPGNNRPLKDVVVSHCGQLVRVTSMTFIIDRLKRNCLRFRK